ncbi:hypothetical protein LCGC14_2213320, partial [marine sediment metagenome]
MLFGLIKDPYIAVLEAQNEQMRKELTEIHRKEFIKAILPPSPSGLLGALGSGNVPSMPL